MAFNPIIISNVSSPISVPGNDNFLEQNRVWWQYQKFKNTWLKAYLETICMPRDKNASFKTEFVCPSNVYKEQHFS